ncbi:hypothetical protein Y1Q_0009707 [Alligator mississippiensis]|uniref:Uncharacterized protein n=1 Tax=Alligator mississippiensis TaxID=8496 RepID=A0A151MWH0_ALLMI|nr:hypothetical protein Y1Q_0009707 [Alligator mississippiensis]
MLRPRGGTRQLLYGAAAEIFKIMNFPLNLRQGKVGCCVIGKLFPSQLWSEVGSAVKDVCFCVEVSGFPGLNPREHHRLDLLSDNLTSGAPLPHVRPTDD